jgi:hypothetical protein
MDAVLAHDPTPRCTAAKLLKGWTRRLRLAGEVDAIRPGRTAARDGGESSVCPATSCAVCPPAASPRVENGGLRQGPLPCRTHRPGHVTAIALCPSEQCARKPRRLALVGIGPALSSRRRSVKLPQQGDGTPIGARPATSRGRLQIWISRHAHRSTRASKSSRAGAVVCCLQHEPPRWQRSADQLVASKLRQRPIIALPAPKASEGTGSRVPCLCTARHLPPDVGALPRGGPDAPTWGPLRDRHVYPKDIDQIVFGLALGNSEDAKASPNGLRPRLTVVPTKT